jgi:hypothetical protein
MSEHSGLQIDAAAVYAGFAGIAPTVAVACEAFANLGLQPGEQAPADSQQDTPAQTAEFLADLRHLWWEIRNFTNYEDPSGLPCRPHRPVAEVETARLQRLVFPFKALREKFFDHLRDDGSVRALYDPLPLRDWYPLEDVISALDAVCWLEFELVDGMWRPKL